MFKILAISTVFSLLAIYSAFGLDDGPVREKRCLAVPPTVDKNLDTNWVRWDGSNKNIL
jgi:hypothetical protein